MIKKLRKFGKTLIEIQESMWHIMDVGNKKPTF
jgi:hypothetical protein